MSKFAYAEADPVDGIDPSGHEAIALQSLAISTQAILLTAGVSLAASAALITAYDSANTRQRAKAAAMACAASIAMTAIGTRSPCGLNPYPMVFMRQSVIPAITQHVAASQAAGRPNVLHRTANPLLIAANRLAATGKCLVGATLLPAAGISCDEYPFASTYEGGLAATVRFVPLHEQLSQGGTLSSFYALCSIVPEVPGLQDFLVVPVISAPRSFAYGRFSR